MSGEVLAHGDDDPRRGPGRALGVVVAVALLAIVGVAVARSQAPEPAAKPSPAPSDVVPTPSQVEIYDPEPVPDPFASFVTVPRPPPGVVRAALLPEGVPGFLMPGDELPLAVGAVGGPEHARVLVGWCAAAERFEDAEGRWFYAADGRAINGMEGLPTYEVRRSARRGRLDIGGEGSYPVGDEHPAPARRCPGRLYYPALPARAATVHETVGGHRVVRGRYTVTTESRSFCELTRSGCAGTGWQVDFLGALPPGDLAGSYVWEGDFVVRGDQEGVLTAVRLPGARLVSRERVGVAARIGLAHGVVERGGTLTLRFNPFRHRSGSPPDDSPPGPAEVAEQGGAWASDIEGGERRYVLRPDAEVHLGEGVTGIGQPAGTPATLRAWLAAKPVNRTRLLWIVLDGRGRVIRVVAEP